MPINPKIKSILIWAGFAIVGAILLMISWQLGNRQRQFEAGLVLYREAVALEGKWQLQPAYRRYVTLCDEMTFRPRDGSENPCNSTVRLDRRIAQAYDETMAALNTYRGAKGRYPDSLQEVRQDISEASLPAFSGFEYQRLSDSKIHISTGQYGTVSFRLK